MTPDGEDIYHHAEAVPVSATMRGGEPEFIDTDDPLKRLLATESAETPAAPPALADVMAFLFGGGSPHPAHVLRRLVELTREVEPVLLHTLPRAELRALLDAHGHDYRLRAILRGTRRALRPASQHERIILATLHRAAGKRKARGLGLERPLVEIGAVLDYRRGESLAAYRRRMVAVAAVLRYFHYDGPEPQHTIVRVFAIGKFYFSDLLWDMTVRDLGAITGVEGATWSERVKQKVNRFFAARGAAGEQARYQKSPEACRALSRAQRGNLNRRGGHAHAPESYR